jgi:hypothetical protein
MLSKIYNFLLRITTCYTLGHEWIYHSKFNKESKKYCAWRVCNICSLTQVLSCPNISDCSICNSSGA